MRRHAAARILAIAVLAAGGSLRALAADASISGILERHCVACHGPQVQNAHVRLDNLSTDTARDRRAAETWHDVRNALNRGAMPPEGAPQLSAADRTAMLGWLDTALSESSDLAARAPGHVVMRRLNRSEYQNTMRDLLGLDVDFVKNLPPDEVSPDGFTNNGAALRMSALQIEHYLRAAQNGLALAIVEGPAPPVFEHRAIETVVDKLKNVHWSKRLGRTGTFVARIPQFPDEGEYVLRIRARSEAPPGAPHPRMLVRLGYRADTQTPSRDVAEVDVPDGPARTFEFRGRIEEFPIQSRAQSKYPGMLVWVSNVYSDGQPPPLGEKVDFEEDGKIKQKLVWPVDPDFPAIVVEALEFKAPAYADWPPEHHQRLVADAPPAREDEALGAEIVLRRFMRRAYRRPVDDADLAPMLRFFGKVRPRVASFEQALRETLAMVLVSPDFLYRIERQESENRHVNDHELASRLSYFLWGTMPDERLMELADRGELADGGLLRAETLRLLDDPRSWAFVEQFSDQWLDLTGVQRVAINPNYYLDFDPSLKQDMRRETQHFFAYLLRENLSALNFLRSDFSVLNHRMARHYGISGPRGGAFEPVSLAGSGRPGGIAAHASVLLANSTGEDSHPVERGVWIRTALLGDPPAPPPPSVPNLDSGNADATLLPLKRQLELHLDNAACAHCHSRIDPWGVALEEFDAVGLRRSSVLRRSGDHAVEHAVDASAILPDGQRVDGAEALADYMLASQRGVFARALTEKLLAYALGRGLTAADQSAVAEMTAAFEIADYRLRELCTIIVTSDSFRSR